MAGEQSYRCVGCGERTEGRGPAVVVQIGTSWRGIETPALVVLQASYVDSPDFMERPRQETEGGLCPDCRSRLKGKLEAAALMLGAAMTSEGR